LISKHECKSDGEVDTTMLMKEGPTENI